MGTARTRQRANGVLEITLKGRYADLVSGKIPVESLDDEELARCQLKDKNGRFTGRPPTMIPREIVMRMQKEFLKRGDDLFRKSYTEAAATFGRIMADEKVDPAIRLKAAQYIVERIAGKTPDTVEIKSDAKFVMVLRDIVVSAEEAGIIDAEVVGEVEG